MIKSTGFKKIKSKRIRNQLKYLAVTVILCMACLVGCVFYYAIGVDQPRFAYASIRFNYKGCSSGLTPNGLNFDINELRDEEILSAALESCGMTEQYDPHEVARCVEIEGAYPEEVLDMYQQFNSLLGADARHYVYDEQFYPVLFSIRVYDNFDSRISSAKLRRLASAITETYKTYFLEKFIYTADSVEIWQIYDETSLDYLDAIEVVDLRLNLLRRYANELYQTNSTYSVDGKLFNSISQQAEYLQKAPLSNLRSYVTLNGLTKNVSRTEYRYNYRIQNLNNELSILPAQKSSLTELMDGYVTDGTKYIGSGDSLLAIEGNSASTYEALVGQQVGIDDLAAEDTRLINVYEAYLSDVRSAAANVAEKRHAEEELKHLNENLEALEQEFTEMLDAFNQYIVSSDSIITNENTGIEKKSIVSMSMIKLLVKCELPLVLLIAIFICANEFVKGMKRFRSAMERAKKIA